MAENGAVLHESMLLREGDWILIWNLCLVSAFKRQLKDITPIELEAYGGQKFIFLRAIFAQI